MLLGIYVGVIALYTWAAWRAVLWLKSRLVEPYTGKVKHRFWPKLEPKAWVLYGVLYLGGLLGLAAIYNALLGGPHMESAVFTMSPAAITFVLGYVYEIPRYRWAAFAGFAACVALELLLTTPASYTQGPVDFLDVSPKFGSIVLPMAVWGVVWLVLGVLGITSVRRQRHGS
jgi:hypothetical protein